MDMALEQRYKEILLKARATIQRLQQQVDAFREPVAIIGMACLFPGDNGGDADTPDLFGRLLAAGYDAVAAIPPDRARWWRSRHGEKEKPQSPGLDRAALLKQDIFSFDRELFGLTPAEARMTDPQHRLLLELSWLALLDAGLSPESLRGSDTGVFVGKSGTDFLFDILGTGRSSADDPYTLTGNMHSALAGRISHFHDWHGPSLSFETACSTALAAVMAAVTSLRSGECSLALAGGVNLLLGPTPSHWLNSMHSLAADGRCKAFGAGADGFGRGEGGGAVILQRLADARRAGNRIHALILGGAVGSDGKSGSFTAPNGKGQRLVMTRALADAGVAPAEVAFVETHGTGTPLGDPIEAESLAQVYGPREEKLLIGSVKSNIGHLEGASGIAALIKAVLAVRDGRIPKTLHSEPPNPLLDWDSLPIKPNRHTLAWPAVYERRIAAIDSFAIAGTLVHLLVAEFVPPPRPENDQRTTAAPQILTLSARSREDLQVMADDCLRRLEEGNPLAEMCLACALARPHEEERLALTAADAAEAIQGLQAFRAGKSQRNLVCGRRQSGPPPVLFLFSGQGSQLATMGRELYAAFPSFRQTLDRCEEVAAPRLGASLRDILFAADEPRLHQTRFTQPAIYAHQAALADLCRELGIGPAAVLGHSIGEYAAAYAAGVFTLETGLEITLKRGELVSGITTAGGMAAVLAGETDVLPTLDALPGVSVAAVNGDATVTIAGVLKEVEEACLRLREQGLESRPLPVSHAFHCPLVEPLLDDFRAFLRRFDFRKPAVPFLSACRGAYLPAETDWPDYFCAQTRQPVRFADAVKRAETATFLELGAQPTLTAYGRQIRGDATWLFTQNGALGLRPLAQALARLYVAGYPIGRGWPFSGEWRPEAAPRYRFRREQLLPPPWAAEPQDQAVPPPPETFLAPPPAIRTLADREDPAVQLAIMQCDIFRQVCAMQNSLLAGGAGNAGPTPMQGGRDKNPEPDVLTG